jgi:DNA repair protein RAD5
MQAFAAPRQQQHNTMESPHPDERPAKKRRFFTEDSSPAQVRSKRSTPPPQTPPPVADSHVQPQPEEDTPEDTGTVDGFDVGMLQAVVGELSMPILQKLKDVSGNNVERGRRTTCIDMIDILTSCSNQPVS